MVVLSGDDEILEEQDLIIQLVVQVKLGCWIVVVPLAWALNSNPT